MENKLSVFGASGFIGGNLCRLYSSDTVSVPRVLRTSPTPNIVNLISTTHNYHVKYGDFHIDINTNLFILMEMLEEAVDRYGSNFTFNQVSTWFTYGDAPLPARERDYYEPKGSYSATKQCAENLLKSTAETYGFKYRIFRLANVYGKGDTWSIKKNYLQFAINEIKHNRDINLYHGGHFQRDYLHVDDVCRAIMYCIVNAPTNEIINIGSGNGYNFRTLMMDAIAFSGSKSKINHVDPPSFHNKVQVKDMRLDISKLKRLGFIPSISIRDGIKELCKDANTL